VFAGEATCATHPATAHGAFTSGLAAAAKVTMYATAAATDTTGSSASSSARGGGGGGDISSGSSSANATAALEALATAYEAAVVAEKEHRPRKRKGRKSNNW